jgi:hypothetical protein
MPCGAAYKLAGISDPFAKYPKMKALAARTAAVPTMSEYLASSKTMGQGAFGFENTSKPKPKMFYFPIAGMFFSLAAPAQ